MTFDATMAGPTTKAATTTTFGAPPSQTTTSTGDSTTVYPTQPRTTDSTAEQPRTIGPSTTASTVEQPAATTPMSATTAYAGTTAAPYPVTLGGQLMRTGGFGLRAVLAGTALSLLAGSSMLYMALRARSRRPGGSS